MTAPRSETECTCGSLNTRLVNSEDDIDIFECKDCGEWFENDTFIAHPKQHKTDRLRKMRRTDDA